MQSTPKVVKVSSGQPSPLGATSINGGINYAIYAKDADALTLCLYQPTQTTPCSRIELERTGDIWHICIVCEFNPIIYTYELTRNNQSEGNLKHVISIDPYTKNIDYIETVNSHRIYRSVYVEHYFDWQNTQHPNTPIQDTIIYEAHIAGLTKSPSSNTEYPGTYEALIEKIPHIKSLGVTAIELMPVMAFNELDIKFSNPDSEKPLTNYWGYNSISFFSPHLNYTKNITPGSATQALKEVVRTCHQHGIEVFLDVVYNHTGEGGENGIDYSYRALAESTYYLIDEITSKYSNYSGCGNTLNCNHPIVSDLIIDSLRYWVTDFHIDGFRFDLASIFSRGEDGNVLTNPPIIRRIENDPILSKSKLFAECWDASGLYQMGSFPGSDRWLQWNGKFRDDSRRFLKGDEKFSETMTKRLLGSHDLFNQKSAQPQSVNFITCHDGFTLADLVSFNTKRNSANGENNRDGETTNHSWNCGHEGKTNNLEIISLRERQIRNCLTLTLLSDGVPLLLYGDECMRTQHGNNNSYCQDNESTWLNWHSNKQLSTHLEFYKFLIQFRKSNPVLSKSLAKKDNYKREIFHHGIHPHDPDYSDQSHSICIQIMDSEKDETHHLLIIINAYWEPLTFTLPNLENMRWKKTIDTVLPEKTTCLTLPQIEKNKVTLISRSICVFTNEV